MLVTRGLGSPGGLLVAGGLGRGVVVPVVWLPDLAPFELTTSDPRSLLLADRRGELHEDLVATLAYDRGPDLFSDCTLMARDAHAFSDHATVELELDHSNEVTR